MPLTSLYIKVSHGVNIEDIQLARKRYVLTKELFDKLRVLSLTSHVARDLTLDAAQAARSSRTSTRSLPPAQIKKLLDSRNDRDILDGLRKVISVCQRSSSK